MLTQSEHEWLNNRDNHAEHFCRWCDIYKDCLGDLGAIFCPSWTQKEQLREAAEFETRVAAKLADPYFPPIGKGSTLEFGHFIMPPMDRLMCARITVEHNSAGYHTKRRAKFRAKTR